MRLGSFNLENIFDRAKALNQDTIAEGKVVLDEFAHLNKLFSKPVYTAADKTAILKGLADLGVLKDDNAGKFVLLRQNRGKLLKRPKSGPVEVVANGRGDWIGWLELKPERIDEIATQNTGQVVRDIAADVLGTIEVDNRIALLRFNEQILPAVNAEPYPHVMLIDGNDDRGIDVGVLSRFPFGPMRSHVDDLKDGSRIFSRDCPEYEIVLPSGNALLVLVNHLKSKGFGTPADSSDAPPALSNISRRSPSPSDSPGVYQLAIGALGVDSGPTGFAMTSGARLIPGARQQALVFPP